jgi:hypothetical protein
MWLFTTKGYVSIVAHREEKDELLVRARTRRDLEDFLGKGTTNIIEETPEADYRWRAVVLRREVALLISRYVQQELTYDNFKNAAGDRDAYLDDILARLWRDLRRWQQDTIADEYRRRSRPALRVSMPVCKPCKNRHSK